jgi:glyoxylase-like metal-dependent hydrolase (beta-lactamase superfamily II)
MRSGGTAGLSGLCNGAAALGLALAPSLLAASADGGWIRQAVAELDPMAVSLQVDFGVDPAAGKAWAEIVEQGRDPEAMPSIRHVDVTGLHFDVSAAAVVLQRRGLRAVCARQGAERRGWGRRATLEATGDCRWAVEPRGKAFDNGFQVAADAAPFLVLLGRATAD